MLDARTRDLLVKAETKVRHDGLNLWETLEQTGLILSEDQRRQIKIETLQWVVALLEQQPHTSIAHLGGAQTVTGAVNGCVRFIELTVEGMK